MALKAMMLAGTALTLAVSFIMLLIELALCHHDWRLAKPDVDPDVREDGGEERRNMDGGEDVQGPDIEEDVQEPHAEGGQNNQAAELDSSRHTSVISRAWTHNAFKILRPVQYTLAPGLLAMLAGSFAIASFIQVFHEGASVIIPSSSSLSISCQSPLKATVDADIGGAGVHTVLLAQIIMLTMFAIIGNFTRELFGMKETGAGLVTTHFALAFALAVQIRAGTLTSAEAVLGAMLLNAQGSGISITLAAKDVLAARWQVLTSITGQIFGLVVLIICMAKFVAGDFVGEDTCFCIKAFWWGWVTDCPETTKAVEAAVFWLYLAFRTVIFVQQAIFAATHTHLFHLTEKQASRTRNVTGSMPTRTPANVAEDSPRPDSQTPSSQSPGNRARVNIENPPDFYTKCRATFNFLYAIHVVLSAMSLVAVHKVMTSGMKPSSGFGSFGQMMAMVVAVVSMVRGLWLLLQARYVQYRAQRDATE